MKLAYYPGCTLKGSAKEYDISMQKVFSKLGIELIEIPDWACCGATSAHATNENLALNMGYIHLTQAEEMKLDTICVPCSACFNRLKVTEHFIKNDKEKFAMMKKTIGKNYKGTVTSKHPITTIVEDYGLSELQKRVKKKLSNLKVASYYGCLLVRPNKITNFDDAENPQIMEKLVKSLGAIPIDFTYKQECCGASYSASKPKLANTLTHRVIKDAKEQGADCILVGCPLCHINLDLKQKEIEEQEKDKLNMPIIYFSQLIGLALGMDARELSLHSHFVDTIDMLKEKKIIE